jgi:GntR family transcriptional regulator/MocR family aminotransferase
VAITSGASGALDLLSRVLLDPGDRVGVEDPGYPGATVRFRALGADVVPLPVDDQGCRVPTEDGLRAVFVTPGHQFPTGVTMGLPRRLALLDWARASGALVLEDDYDSEFWYGGQPLPVLQGLDRHGTVALVGSFSKTVGPAIRLGFVVLPPDLVDPFARAAWVPGGPGSAVDQTVLADFLAGGHYSRHLRRTRETYAGRLAVLQEEVGRRLGGALSLSGVEAGLQTVGWLAPGLDAEAVTGRAAALGVLVVPVSRYAARPLVRDGLRLGFASVGEGQIRWGVEQLARAVDGLPGAP